MIQIFLNDEELVYDSRLQDSKLGNNELLGLTVERELNKGGVAQITMPPGHSAYKAFVS